MSRLSWGSAVWLAGRGRGSDRLRWVAIIVAMTVIGVLVEALATVLVLPARGVPWRLVPGGFGWDFLADRNTLPGTLTALLCLAVPALLFAVQAARVGMPVTDRRFAALRAAGASERDLRRVVAGEAALAGVLGSVTGLLAFAGLWALARRTWRLDAASAVLGPDGVGYEPVRLPVLPPLVLPWWGAVMVVLVTAGLGVLVGLVSRPGRRQRRRPVRVAPGLAQLAAAVVLLAGQFPIADRLLAAFGVSGWFTLAASCAVLVLWVSGWLALAPAVLGRALARSTASPVRLLAGSRMAAHPRAVVRPAAALQLIAVLLPADLILRPALRDDAQGDPGQVRGWAALVDSVGTLVRAMLVAALVLAALSLLLAAVEAQLWRHRSTARQVFAGVPRTVLHRAVVVETALPALVLTTLTLVLTSAVLFLIVRSAGVGPAAYPLAGVLLGAVAGIAAVAGAAWVAARLVSESVDVRELRTT